MKTIIITSAKGGAGKTTLALNLGVAAAAEGLRTCLIDLDPQKSLRGWWSAREGTAPAMLDQDPSPATLEAVQTGLAKNFDLVIVDTPPAAPDWLGKIMKRADLVLIPVRPSPHDLRAVGATLREVKAAGTEYAFVLSQTPRAKLTEQTARALAQFGRVAPVNINQRIIFAESGATGQGVIETPDAKAADEVRGVWEFVKRDIGL